MRAIAPPACFAMSAFRPTDRKTAYLLPPSVEDWLPEDHLARFIVEVVDGLDVSALERAYRGRGSAAYHPALLLSLLVYGYATGVFSSRRIERATYDSVASASSLRARIQTTTRWQAFGGASWTNWPISLCRCWNWPRK
jgi:hypothetical protein